MKQYDKKIVGMEEEKKALSVAVKNDMPTLLVGPTGCGKTHLLYELGLAMKKNLSRVNLTGDITINELLGKWLIKNGSTYWQDGVLVEAMRNGDWIIFDEINAALPEILFCVNSLLDGSRSVKLAEKDGEIVKAHKDFRFFAAMNPSDDYAGTKELNKSLLSRFGIVIEIGHHAPEIELEILKAHTSVDEVVACTMVDCANMIRKLRNKGDIYYTMSTRDLISWGHFYKSNEHSLCQSFALSILNKAGADERDAIIKIVLNKYPKAFDKDMALWNKTSDFASDYMSRKLLKIKEAAEGKHKKTIEEQSNLINELNMQLKSVTSTLKEERRVHSQVRKVIESVNSLAQKESE